MRESKDQNTQSLERVARETLNKLELQIKKDEKQIIDMKHAHEQEIKRNMVALFRKFEEGTIKEYGEVLNRVRFFQITGNPTTKKNSQQIMTKGAGGKPFIMQSQKYLEYEKRAVEELKAQIKDMKPIDYPVSVTYIFIRDSRRRCDLNGLIQAADDILVKAGVLKDDNFQIVASHDNSRVFVGKGIERTMIQITPLYGYEQDFFLK